MSYIEEREGVEEGEKGKGRAGVGGREGEGVEGGEKQKGGGEGEEKGGRGRDVSSYLLSFCCGGQVWSCEAISIYSIDDVYLGVKTSILHRWMLVYPTVMFDMYTFRTNKLKG